MPLELEPTVQQAIVEVRYQNGMVYLDRCGTLTNRLQEVLGKPFRSTMPGMEFAEFRNNVEHITVRYGIKALVVQQEWTKSIVRVEHLAPLAWEQVSKLLDVERVISRCGVRIIFNWRVGSTKEGEQLLRGSGLVSETPVWADEHGTPESLGFSAKYESLPSPAELRGGTLRIGMNVAELVVEESELHENLRNVIPKYAVQADLDYTQPGTEPYALGRGQLKDFIRAAWLDAKRRASMLGKRLEQSDDG